MTQQPFRRGLVTAVAVVLGLGIAARSRGQEALYADAEGVGLEGTDAGTHRDAGDAPGKVTVSWEDGTTSFQFENALVTLSNRIQFRFTQERPDDTIQLPGTQARGDGRGSFRIRRAKTKLEGWIWDKDLTYELQLGWAGSDSTGGSSTFSGLEDARLTWDASGDHRFEITIGQFKVPFGRQEMTSSEKLQFVDRDILSGEFTHSRDVGFSVGGLVAQGKLDYRAGAFNGNQRNQPNNDNDKYQYDARLTFQPWGDLKYSEGDFESKDKALLAVAGDFERNTLTFQLGPTSPTNQTTTIFGGDVVFKYKGFSAFGELFSRKREQPGTPSFHSDGWHAQAGYFVKRNKLEVAFRYVSWDPSDQVADNDVTEVGGAVNYFIHKHNLKVQADFRQVKDELRDAKSQELRVQAQLVF